MGNIQFCQHITQGFNLVFSLVEKCFLKFFLKKKKTRVGFGLANGGISSLHCLDEIHKKMLQEINKSFEHLFYKNF